jgi:type-F conjugative transfer system pilin assembly protein TrbC
MNKFKTLLVLILLPFLGWCNAEISNHIPSQKALQDLTTAMTAKAAQYKTQSVTMKEAAYAQATEHKEKAEVIADAGKEKWLEIMEILKAQNHDQARMDATAKQFQGLLIFASLGMPEMSLKALLKQADHLGVPIIIQGVLPEGFMATVKKMMHLITPDKKSQKGELPIGGIVIEPNWFKHFGITQVPAFVLTDQLVPCVGQDCKVTEHDVLYGNISLYDALNIFRQKGSIQFQGKVEQFLTIASGSSHG